MCKCMTWHGAFEIGPALLPREDRAQLMLRRLLARGKTRNRSAGLVRSGFRHETFCTQEVRSHAACPVCACGDFLCSAGRFRGGRATHRKNRADRSCEAALHGPRSYPRRDSAGYPLGNMRSRVPGAPSFQTLVLHALHSPSRLLRSCYQEQSYDFPPLEIACGNASPDWSVVNATKVSDPVSAPPAFDDSYLRRDANLVFGPPLGHAAPALLYAHCNCRWRRQRYAAHVHGT